MSNGTIRKLAPSLQGRLSLLVAAVVFFGATLAFWLIWQGFRNERHAMERHLGDTARALTALMDTEFSKREAMLKGLALSRNLRGGDVQAFDAQARELIPGGDDWIVVTDENVQQLVNTALPPGAKLPRTDPLPGSLEAMRSGKTFISDLFVGVATQRHVSYVAIPVPKAGGGFYQLCMSLTPQSFSKALLGHGIGDGWLVAVVDRNLTIAARSRNAEAFVGKPASANMTRLINTYGEGVFDTTTLDGIPSITAFHRSARSGYTVVVAAPRADLFQGAQKLAFQALGVAITACILALFFALWVGRSIIAGMHALVGATATLGRGERIEAKTTGITEIDVVSRALSEASKTLAAREAALARARDEALAASRAKDEFLASLSHELRTPLNPVLLMASDGANDPTHTPALRETFQSIARNVSLEARLIDDLLDLTRISSGKLSLHLQPVPIDALLRDTVETLRRTIDEKPLNLVLDLACGGAATTADPTRLRQVFWNLLNNAIKFTPSNGRLTIVSKVDPAAERIVVDVTDSGMGMSAGEISRLFQRFAQGDHAAGGNQSAYGGLGLGLVIARTLVELHQGEILAKSEGRGKGSTFTVRLPLLYQVPVSGGKAPRPSSAPAPIPVVPSTGKKRILLIEDHKPTLVTLERLLMRRGYDVSAASTASAAIEFAAGNRYDLVISDIGLPDRTGYELMRELGERYGLRGIAMSGFGADSDRAQGREAGFLMHLTKPVDIASLEDALAKVLTLP